MTLATIRSMINNDMPTAEVNYYLLLLLRSLDAHNLESGSFVDELEQFTLEFKSLIETMSSPSSAEQLPTQFNAINLRFQKLVDLSNTNTLGIKVGYALLHVIGAVAALLCGIIGGLIGGVAGFARGLWSVSNPLKAAGIGVVMGLALGGIIGFRAPKKLAKDEFIRQLKYSLDGINKCIKNVQAQVGAPLSSYNTLVINKYFGGNLEKFEHFKTLEEVSYSIDTLKATFISPSLENYLGHHSLIKIQHTDIKINPENGETDNIALVEFSTSKADISRPVSQTDPRKVHGSKVVEMLLFHEQLQLTHAPTTNYLLTGMKQGEVDCLSYVNKILTGTRQKATTVQRFDGTENSIGTNLIGFFIKKLNPFAQDALIDRPIVQP